ncbi:NAD(P)-binding domain-containing protein [Rhizobium herbae]|uniref:Cation diffusion facilitator CzcD-associated flavoprotein CzcO n=1 Tax=Rhizobium herbae TaxID=508661 RepID=A0ABS4EQW7_9HYPH|nr:NAD(P)/FAD-dependent oxidoreductase [Rhizobium herbae]MBP1860335.1 cation diffusion facilitator CzcD-associated flavoprotein CzcO [Rhizobium herbae]
MMIAPIDTPRMTLDGLKQEALADLALLGYPNAPWLNDLPRPDAADVADVIIVGGGQSGITIAAALKWDGLRHIRVLDSCAPGAEGPWLTFARMEELRTPKTQVGNEFNVVNLSVRRWFETRYGHQAWADLSRIPRTDWKAYLDWYADVFEIAITNHCEVLNVAPQGDLIAVTTRMGGRIETSLARTVVLATGYDGAGVWRVPPFISAALSPDRFDHTNGPVDFDALKGLRVGVLGHGASAFDNAIKALEAGAAAVDLCFRRARLPRTNPHRAVETPGMMTHYPDLSENIRWDIARFFRSADQPPPVRSFETAMSLENFRLRPATPWLEVSQQADAIHVTTSDGVLEFDHLLLATGMDVDLAVRPELRTIHDKVALWGERYTPQDGSEDARLARFPYLDGFYGFIPKDPGDAWVSRVFAFNSSSFVSHGPHSTSISGHKHAVPRLVRGVLRRLLLDREAVILPELKAYISADLPIPDDFEMVLAEANRQPERSPETGKPAMRSGA